MSATTDPPVHTLSPDPQPPSEGEDRTQWRTVYRGRGAARHVDAIVEVTLTPEQKMWLDAMAAQSGLTLAEAVSRALDLAREQHGRPLAVGTQARAG
jgi:hypothetical protein